MTSESWFAAPRLARAGFIIPALVLILMGLSASCGGGSSSPDSVTSNSALILTPSSPTVLQTETLQLHAMMQASDGSMQDVTTSALWSSSTNNSTSIESIGQEFPGLATGNAAGSTTITAKFNGMTASATLNCISNYAPQALSVLPSTVTVAVGTVQQFRAAETMDRNGTEETGIATWTVSDTSKATIETAGQSTPGVLTAISPGTITVTATSPDGLTNTATVVIPGGLPNTYKIPVPEMLTGQNYLSYSGGLYENDSNTPPADHDAAGLAAAAAVQPLDTSGNPSPSGNIVLLGVGMSNAYYELTAFTADADVVGSGANYPTVMTLNGAKPEATTCWWTLAEGVPVCDTSPLGNQYDRVLTDVLTPAGLTEAQVQVLWIKEADPFPAETLNNPSLCDPSVTGCINNVPLGATGSGCTIASTAEACYFDKLLGEMVRAAKVRYPNLKQMFISSRIYGGYVSFPLNPEPYAYEYGLAAKWFIENQVIQARTGQADPVSGDLSYTDGSTAWAAWGPYIWANSVEPQTFDGIAWETNPIDDYLSDGTHPSAPAGEDLVAAQLIDFFLTSPYTPWFRAVPGQQAKKTR